MNNVMRPEEVTLRHYLHVLRKRWGVIAACFVVVVSIVAVRTYLQQPIYRAAARVLIERETQIVNFQQTPSLDWDNGEFFQSQPVKGDLRQSS